MEAGSVKRVHSFLCIYDSRESKNPSVGGRGLTPHRFSRYNGVEVTIVVEHN
jgi:hypothetical protein